MGQVSYDFSGRTAVVTGGAAGIGRAIAEFLRDAGADVHIWDLETADYPGVTGRRVDVADPDSVSAAADALLQAAGRVDLLINNAGFAGPTGPLEQTDPRQWRRVVDVNLIGVYEVCRRLVPAMKAAGRGRIVNIASLAGKEGTPQASAYAAAKAGVIALTKALGKELALARTDIRVNAVAPAAVDTAILQQMAPEFVQIMIDKSPLGRLGRVDEVAKLVAWLCSDDCSFSTGAVFDLSGGRAVY